MDLTEKRLSGELKYTGVIVSVTLDTVELCDGKQTLREVVHHPGGVGVLPIDADGNWSLDFEDLEKKGLMNSQPAGTGAPGNAGMKKGGAAK